MKPEIKQEWVAELRSGDYIQGRGNLKTKRTFYDDVTIEHCCLGVLCDIAVKHDVIPEPTVSLYSYYYGSNQDTAILPVEVVNWAGMDEEGPSGGLEKVVPPKSIDTIQDDIDCLTQANDNGYTFAEIADIIEEQF